MHRTALLNLLAAHEPYDDHEATMLRQTIAFVREHERCFERDLSVGHITGSAWLLDRSHGRVLLTFHRKLNMWLQLGGHAEGDPDVLAVAVREAHEESGLTDITPIHAGIFDVDIHPIPAHAKEPPHLHYDVRFLLEARGSDRFVVSDESHDLAWVSPEELLRFDVDDSVRRMHRKWREWLARRDPQPGKA